MEERETEGKMTCSHLPETVRLGLRILFFKINFVGDSDGYISTKIFLKNCLKSLIVKKNFSL